MSAPPAGEPDPEDREADPAPEARDVPEDRSVPEDEAEHAAPADGVPDEQPGSTAPADAVPDTVPADWTDTPASSGEDEPEPERIEDAADIDALAEHISELEAKLGAAERRADELVVVAKRQAEMADQLHAENQALRDGEIREAVAPLIRHAARIADEVTHMRDDRPDDADLEHVAKKLGELLHDAGVTAVTPMPGDAFDARAHQAAGAEPTDDAAMDRRVAAVRKPGLVRDDGRQLRPAEVVVFRHTPNEGAP